MRTGSGRRLLVAVSVGWFLVSLGASVWLAVPPGDRLRCACPAIVAMSRFTGTGFLSTSPGAEPQFTISPGGSGTLVLNVKGYDGNNLSAYFWPQNSDPQQFFARAFQEAAELDPGGNYIQLTPTNRTGLSFTLQSLQKLNDSDYRATYSVTASASAPLAYWRFNSPFYPGDAVLAVGPPPAWAYWGREVSTLIQPWMVLASLASAAIVTGASFLLDRGLRARTRPAAF